MSGAPFTFRAWSLLITLVEGGEMVVVDNFCCVTIKLENPSPPKSFNPPTFQAKNSDWCFIFLL